MEGNKNRPSSPAIKRTPTVKRGPVPPRVARKEPGKPEAGGSAPKGRPTPPSAKSASTPKGRPTPPSAAGAGAKKTPPTPPSRGGVKSKPTGPKKGKKKTGLIVGIGAGVLVLLLVLLLAPIFDGESMLTTLANDTAQPVVTEEEIVLDEEPVEEEITDEEFLNVDESAEDDVTLDVEETGSSVAVEEPSAPAVTITDDMIASKTGRHYVILGSFSVQENAFRLKNKLGGNAKIIAPTGGGRLYKVSINDYASVAEANAALESSMEEYGVDIWVLSY